MDPDRASNGLRTRVVVATATCLVVAAIVLAAGPGRAQCPGHSDPEVGTLEGSPLDDLPAHISLVVPFGQRPDWSRDGRTLLFLDGAVAGDVWTVDVATGATRNLTGEFPNHQGFARAHFLPSGDILLCGPTSGPTPTPQRPEDGRFNGVLWVLRAPFEEPPQSLGMACWEGVAVSKHSREIAWNRSHIDFTDPDLIGQVVFGISEIWTGTLELPPGPGEPPGQGEAATEGAREPLQKGDTTTNVLSSCLGPRGGIKVVRTRWDHPPEK